MKRKLFSLLVLLLNVMGGVNLWAARVDAVWSTPAANGAWDSENNVYSWTLGYSNLATVFETPDGDLANYTALHLTTADYTSEYRVCFMEGSNAKATITFYSAGQKDLVFAERNETKDLDLSTIDHISFGGASGSGSITVTNMYLEGPDAPALELITKTEGEYDFINIAALEQQDGSVTTLTPTVENDEYTYTATSTLQFGFKHKNINVTGYNQLVVEYSTNSGSWCLQPKEGDLVGWTQLPSGNNKTYTVTIPSGTSTLSELSLFSLPWSTPGSPITVTAIKLHKTPPSNYDELLTADVSTFSMDKLVGNVWSFDTPVDISAYKYMIVTTIQSSGNLNGFMILTDNTGKRAGNNWDSNLEINYDASAAGTRGGMWLDRWNNQHCACINLEYLKEQGLDVTQITRFSVPRGENISAVYLTNYEAGSAVTNGNGEYVRNYNLLSEGEFAMIALKYPAAVSGAKVYTVAGFDANVGLYLTPHYGTLEAGVPYIYEACDFEGHNAADGNKGSNSNVNFYRIDGNSISGDWSDNNTRDNGLVGTYDGGFWPGWGAINNCYVVLEDGLALKNNISEPSNWAKNRGFFDPKKVTSNTTTTKILPVYEIANLKVSEGKYGTFVAPFEVNVPAGVTTYTATYNSETNEVDLTEAGTTIAANTPVIVMGSADVDEDFYGAPAKAETVGTELVGILKDNVNVPAGAYVLQTQNEVQQFYKVATEAKGKKNRCYLNIPSAPVKVLNIVVDGEETAIMNLDADVNAGKAQIFDLSGRKVSKAQNGIYIVNGRKVVK